MKLSLSALPDRLVGEVGPAGGYDDLAAVRLAQDGGHHAGSAKRVGEIWQRLTLCAGERRRNETEEWGEAEHGARVEPF
jgi:hypothetical protein